MIRIIGKIAIILCMSISASLWGTSVILTAHGVNGAILKKAGVGQPFLLEVRIKEITGHVQTPTITGAEQFQLRSSGYQMRTVNGVAEVIYQYRVRIDQVGTYTFGPAKVFDGNVTVESNALSFEVAEEQVCAGVSQAASHADEKEVLLRLTIDKKNIVVGEKVNGRLRFYAQNAVELQQVIEPEISECSGYIIKKKEGPFQGTETLNNKQYSYVEWRWQLYPTKSGACTIPAYAVDYRAPLPQTHFLFNFMHAGQSKRTYSNSAPLTVHALPLSSQTTPMAIGRIDHLKATITPAVAKVGEGLVLTLSVTGDIDFDGLSSLELQHIPAACKWYDSKQYMQENTTVGQETKCFEYIVQPLQPGQYEIPSQQLFYFDVVSHSYKTITTAPLLIQVSGSPVEQPAVQKTPDVSTAVDIVHMPTAALAPLHTTGLHHASGTWGLSYRWFMMSVIALVISAVLVRLWPFRRSFLKRGSSPSKIRLALKEAQRDNNYTALHSLFIAYFAEKMGSTPASVTQENIVQLLREKGFSNAECIEWQHFFTAISEYVYYSAQVTKAQPALFTQSLQWFDRLQKVLA